MVAFLHDTASGDIAKRHFYKNNELHLICMKVKSKNTLNFLQTHMHTLSKEGKMEGKMKIVLENDCSFYAYS